MKIHLITLMAIDLDWDILDFWIDHYKKLDIDTYTVFVHIEQSLKHLNEGTQKLKDAGFNVCPVHGGNQYCEELRDTVMKAYLLNIPKDEFILTVDSDEFQMWPDNDIHQSMMHGEIDLMEGYLIDCFNTTLKPAEPHIPLDIQYPKRVKHLEKRLFPTDKKISNMHQEKICCHKNIINIDFYGSHVIKSIPEKIKGYFRSRGTLDVLHYKWRATTKQRLLTKPWYDEYKTNKILGVFYG